MRHVVLLDRITRLLLSDQNDAMMPSLDQTNSTVDEQTTKYLTDLMQRKQLAKGSVLSVHSRRGGAPVDPHKLSRKVTQQQSEVNADVTRALLASDKWTFDVFQLADTTKKRPLYFLGQALFQRTQIKNMGVSTDKVWDCMFRDADALPPCFSTSRRCCAKPPFALRMCSFVGLTVESA